MQAQREVASLLLPGESVSEGLRRLATAGGGPAAGKGKGETTRSSGLVALLVMVYTVIKIIDKLI
jgi:hypothetical protein